MNQFNILEDCLFTFYAPYFIVVNRVLCTEIFRIFVHFFLLRLKNSLKMKITKEKIRIFLLIIIIPLSNIRIDNLCLALISFQNMISKSIYDISKVLSLFLRKHNPILHSRQKINIFSQFIII